MQFTIVGDALTLVTELVAEFPGLLDGETEVNGADLVEAFTTKLNAWTSEALLNHLKGL